jgi:hypothetical protein
MKIVVVMQIFILLIAVVSCKKESDGSGSTVVDQASINEDPVVAKVDDDLLYQSQLEVMMDKLVSGQSEEDRAKLEQTILQGMIRTRVLANLSEQQLDNDEIRKINAKVKNFRDEILVKSYIEKNIEVEPVTTEMVKQYYQEHLKEYTEQGRISFEFLVTTSTSLDDTAISQVMAELSKAKNIDDWRLYADALKYKKLPVDYNSVSMLPASIDKALRSSIESLAAGEVSDLVFADYIYIVKLISREPDTLKPLKDVSMAIRKKLAPQKFKTTLTQHIDKVMTGKHVEYIH